MKDDSVPAAILGALLLGLAVGVMFFGMPSCAEKNRLKAEAIDLGHAHYNPTTGEWEWVNTEVEK